MKKFSITLAISYFIICGNLVFSEPQVQQPVKQPTQNVVTEDIPETIPEKNYENLMKIKDSATTSKTLNHIFSVLALIILGLACLGGIKLYRDWSNKKYIVEAPPKETLASPQDFKSAINLFLGKTDE